MECDEQETKDNTERLQQQILCCPWSKTVDAGYPSQHYHCNRLYDVSDMHKIRTNFQEGQCKICSNENKRALQEYNRWRKTHSFKLDCTEQEELAKGYKGIKEDWTLKCILLDTIKEIDNNMSMYFGMNTIKVRVEKSKWNFTHPGVKCYFNDARYFTVDYNARLFAAAHAKKDAKIECRNCIEDIIKKLLINELFNPNMLDEHKETDTMDIDQPDMNPEVTEFNISINEKPEILIIITDYLITASYLVIECDEYEHGANNAFYWCGKYAAEKEIDREIAVSCHHWGRYGKDICICFVRYNCDTHQIFQEIDTRFYKHYCAPYNINFCRGLDWVQKVKKQILNSQSIKSLKQDVMNALLSFVVNNISYKSETNDNDKYGYVEKYYLGYSQERLDELCNYFNDNRKPQCGYEQFKACTNRNKSVWKYSPFGNI